MFLAVSSDSLESQGDSGGWSSLGQFIKLLDLSEINSDEYLRIPGDSSPPLAAPGSELSLRSDREDTFRRD